MGIFSKIQAKSKALRNLLYLQSEKEAFLTRFSEKEKRGRFRVFSPELFAPDCTIGEYSYIARGTTVSDCHIGKYCSVGPNCTIGFGQHPNNWPSTSPVFSSSVKIFEQAHALTSHYPHERAPIVIGHDVWIGANVYIRNGVNIGNGAIVAAGAAVVKDVQPYEIVGGVPAKTIRFRFPADVVRELLELNWWDKDYEKLKAIQANFVSEDIRAFIDAVKKL